MEDNKDPIERPDEPPPPGELQSDEWSHPDHPPGGCVSAFLKVFGFGFLILFVMIAFVFGVCLLG